MVDLSSLIFTLETTRRVGGFHDPTDRAFSAFRY